MGHGLKESLKGAGWRPIVAAAVVVLACVLSIGWYYAFQQEKLFAERQAFFTQFSEKTAENIDFALDEHWHHNAVCQEILALSAPQDEADLVAALGYCSEVAASEGTVVMAFTAEGAFYSSDGHAGWFSQEPSVSFAPDAAKQQTAIINLPYDSTERSYFLLFSRMENAMELASGETLSYLALAIDVESMQKLFAVQGFGDSCHVYFVTDTGRKLYQSMDALDFIEGYNILTALERTAEVVGGGTMEDLLAAFESGGGAAFEIAYRDESWFVSFETVSAGSHHLIVFAPTDLIGNNAAMLSDASFWFLVLICLLLGLLFAIVILSVWSMMRKLRELNGLLEKEARAADEAARAADAAARAADAASRAKSEFLSYMSHDIRTPINGIMGMTGIAMRNEGDHAKVMECLGKVDEASRHLLSLVNDVLDMSRIEQGKTAIVSEPVHLPSLLEECASIVEGQLNTRNLEFVRDFADLPHPDVISDELHLRQTLINILGNAVKFTPDGGRVTLWARQMEAGRGDAAGVGRAEDAANTSQGENAADAALGATRLVVKVMDTGIGMEPSYLEHIWEPFSQSEKGRSSSHEGTGLGMAITKRFVDMMGGTIEVESQLGCGSTFTVTLELEVCEGKTEVCEVVAAEDSGLDGLKVLLVEDMELNREIACEILREVGATVACAENGQEAVDAFLGSAPGTFDVVLMDVMMPVMDGLEAARAIRASEHPEAGTMPIVALTANAFDEDVRKALEAGMNCHLTKPIDMRALVKVLSQYRKAAE